MTDANKKLSPRPVIGVPTQTLQAIDGIPASLPHSWVMNDRYLHALAAVGGVPFMVPLLDSDDETLRAIYDRLDGLFLAGGVDMLPSSYGARAHELTGRTDEPRDRVELLLTRWAMAEGKPVLGVCRGMQVINVAAGGTLVQDTSALRPGAIKHDYYPTAGYARDYRAHEATLQPGSHLERIFGSATLHVNSMHHQGVAELGKGLVPVAHAPDGLIEGLESVGNSFVVGVQWHPESLFDSDTGTRELFAAFIVAAGEHAKRRARNGSSQA
jgi:putative glutamine amidotransferase